MVIACCVCTSFDLIVLCYVLESKCLPYSLPQLLQAPAAVHPECLPQSALPTFSCFSQKVLSHSQKKRLRHLYFFLKRKKARLKIYSKRFVDSSVCSSIIIFSGTLRWSLVCFYIQTNCFSSPVFDFLVSSHIIIFSANFSNSGDYWNLSAFLFWLKSQFQFSIEKP